MDLEQTSSSSLRSQFTLEKEKKKKEEKRKHQAFVIKSLQSR
jgi:hypothetical protein